MKTYKTNRSIKLSGVIVPTGATLEAIREEKETLTGAIIIVIKYQEQILRPYKQFLMKFAYLLTNNPEPTPGQLTIF